MASPYGLLTLLGQAGRLATFLFSGSAPPAGGETDQPQGLGRMAVPEIKLGQLWRLDETGESWLVTKTYSEVFASYAVLRKVGGAEPDLRRVKIGKSAEGVTLPGFTFTQESQAF